MFVSKMSMYINEMLPTVLVFIVSTPFLVSLKSQILKKSHLSLFLFMLQLCGV